MGFRLLQWSPLQVICKDLHTGKTMLLLVFTVLDPGQVTYLEIR